MAAQTSDTRDSLWYAGKTGELSGGMTIIGIRLETMLEFQGDQMTEAVKQNVTELYEIVKGYRDGMNN